MMSGNSAGWRSGISLVSYTRERRFKSCPRYKLGCDGSLHDIEREPRGSSCAAVTDNETSRLVLLKFEL